MADYIDVGKTFSQGKEVFSELASLRAALEALRGGYAQASVSVNGKDSSEGAILFQIPLPSEVAIRLLEETLPVKDGQAQSMIAEIQALKNVLSALPLPPLSPGKGK